MYRLVKIQSMGKASLSCSFMHHQGIKFFLCSYTDILITLAFVLRLDSSWSQNRCHSSSDHILTQQCPKFGSGVRGAFPSLYPFLKVRMLLKAVWQLIGHNCACTHSHDNPLQGRTEFHHWFRLITSCLFPPRAGVGPNLLLNWLPSDTWAEFEFCYRAEMKEGCWVDTHRIHGFWWSW